MKIFCFNPAGGESAFWNPLSTAVTQHELVLYEYPGHGTRRREPLTVDMNLIKEEIVSNLHSQIYQGEHYALMGYSMGSVVLFSVLMDLLDDATFPLPDCVILMAHAPQEYDGRAQLSDEQRVQCIKDRVISLGGIPDRLLENSAFWRLHLPLYVNDFTMMWNYDMRPYEGLCRIPAHIFYSNEDISDDEIRHWDDYFVGNNYYYHFNGGHFFIGENQKDIAQLIDDL